MVWKTTYTTISQNYWNNYSMGGYVPRQINRGIFTYESGNKVSNGQFWGQFAGAAIQDLKSDDSTLKWTWNSVLKPVGQWIGGGGIKNVCSSVGNFFKGLFGKS